LHDDGTTSRNKAARADLGHEGDSGPKPRSVKTVYTENPEDASRLSAAGLQGLGPKGARVVIRDGKASLATWNEKAGKWGVPPSSRDIPISTEAGVGKAPVELWNPKDDVYGHEAYGGMHAGNAITEVTRDAEKSPAQPLKANMRAVEGTGEAHPRGLSEGVEASAVEHNLTKGFDDLPEYNRVSMADQAEKAAALIEKDYEAAKDIAMGNKAPPKGILPESIFVAVEKRALAEGDVETLRRLATQSRLVSEATTMGQRIRTLGERDPTSPIDAIQEVQQAREAALAARGTKDIEGAKNAVVEDAKTAIKAAAPKVPAWEKFLSSIECDY
jgi:hypothetical protein